MKAVGVVGHHFLPPTLPPFRCTVSVHLLEPCLSQDLCLGAERHSWLSLGSGEEAKLEGGRMLLDG